MKEDIILQTGCKCRQLINSVTSHTGMVTLGIRLEEKNTWVERVFTFKGQVENGVRVFEELIEIKD